MLLVAVSVAFLLPLCCLCVAFVLVGDDLQLAPISQHKWSKEIRPSLNKFTPWNSIFVFLKRHYREHCLETPLTETYRLTKAMTELIKPVYSPYGIDLNSKKVGDDSFGRIKKASIEEASDLPDKSVVLWDYEGVPSLSGPNGNGNANDKEVKMVVELVEVLMNEKRVEVKKIGIVTPFNDQIKAIKEALTKKETRFKDVKVDTVNKYQGGESDYIIFSAVLGASADLINDPTFVLELQRTNVAFSRAKEQLIVVVNEGLLSYVPSSFGDYKGARLWKNLRRLCT